MDDVLKQAAEALREAMILLDPFETAAKIVHAKASAALAALESAQERPLGAAIAPEHEEAMARMAADAERKHAELVRDAGLWRAAQARQGEALVRFCPGCGSIGEVESKYRDCCPDGSHARRIPESLATRCQSLFRAALESAVAPQPLRELSEDGWLHIETAPKDRFIIAGHEDEGWAEQAQWDHERQEWWAVNTHWTDSTGIALYPTHYRPMPDPPSAMRAARSAK